MRKVLPLTPLHSSTCPPPHLPANGEPSKTMSQPHTISQWQPTQPLRLHRGRGQKPGGPQGAQLEGRRGECLHIVYTPHTWSQPSESRLECSSFTDFLFPIVQEGTVLRLTILRALSCCGGCGRQGPPRLGASLPVLNSISCLGPTRPFSTATGPHHRGLLFGFGSKKCKCNRKLRHSTLAIQSHSIPKTVCVTAGQDGGAHSPPCHVLAVCPWVGPLTPMCFNIRTRGLACPPRTIGGSFSRH